MKRKFDPKDFDFNKETSREFIKSWSELKSSSDIESFLIKIGNLELLESIKEENMNAKLYEETINQLKQENVELRCRLQTVNEECILLDKENRDLKVENKELFKELSDILEEMWEDHRRDCMYDV